VLQEEPDAVLLVAYETRAGDGRPGLAAVRRRLVRAGVGVLDRLVVRDGRWFAVDCVDGCCPAEGTPVPRPADTPAVAEFVGLGVSPLPARDSLADLVAADPERTPSVAAALATRTARSGGLGVAARRYEALSVWAMALGLRDDGGAVADVAGVRPDQLALLVESLRDVQLRDGLIAWLCPGSLPPSCLAPEVMDAVRTCLPERGPGWSRAGRGRGARRDLRRGSGATEAGRRHLRRLQRLVTAVPDEDAAGILTVLANLAWWLGDGALSRTCLERALRAKPDYRLALLLERMLDLGVRPGSNREPWPDTARTG
jgi:hypothetical protein